MDRQFLNRKERLGTHTEPLLFAQTREVSAKPESSRNRDEFSRDRNGRDLFLCSGHRRDLGQGSDRRDEEPSSLRDSASHGRHDPIRRLARLPRNTEDATSVPEPRCSDRHGEPNSPASIHNLPAAAAEEPHIGLAEGGCQCRSKSVQMQELQKQRSPKRCRATS